MHICQLIISDRFIHNYNNYTLQKTLFARNRDSHIYWWCWRWWFHHNICKMNSPIPVLDEGSQATLPSYGYWGLLLSVLIVARCKFDVVSRVQVRYLHHQYSDQSSYKNSSHWWWTPIKIPITIVAGKWSYYVTIPCLSIACYSHNKSVC